MHNVDALTRPWILCLVITCSLIGIAEAKLADSIKVGGQTIALNGVGTRTKAFMSVYESGLYLESPSRNAQEILQADEMMVIRVKILSGFVSRSSLVASLQEGLEKSTGGNVASIASQTQQFLKCLQDEVKKEDIYDFVYVPQKGMYILKNGRLKGNVAGLAFKQAFFGIWLSDQPVDGKLRTAMLSGQGNR